MAKYHMNKKEREMTDPEIMHEILKQGKFTTIAFCRNNEPYIVTMNYGLDTENNALYFHCAQKGLKIDFITSNPHVCATIVEDRGYKMNACEHHFRSVVFWGRMTVVEKLEEKKHAMTILLDHLEDNPDIVRQKHLKTDTIYKKLGILRLDIEDISGKHGN